MKNLFLLLLVFISELALACSFMPSFERFEISESSTVVEAPRKPNLKVAEIDRGSKGDAGMCFDAGRLTIKDGSSPSKELGYIFSLHEGEFNAAVFPDYPVISTGTFFEIGEYSFIWLDGNTTEQEPLEFILKIEAVSLGGTRSEPQYLKVEHPGVKKKKWFSGR